MKKLRFTALVLSAVTVMLAIPVPVTAAQDAITSCGGWFESAYAEWDSAAIGSDVRVSYAAAGADAFTQIDSELIRGTRADIPGLKGNTAYTLRVEGTAGSAECQITTMTYDRTGYAHDDFADIGGYLDDGTLKSDVTVIYVTNENKDTVTYNGKVGLYNIFFSAKPKNVVFRFVGALDVPAGTVANDGSHNDGSNMLYLQNSANVTVEGIGDDCDLIEWGIEMKRCTSCEIRNLHLARYPDDGISMTGNAEIRSQHIWVHNNTIEKGYNAFAGNDHVDADKADGDGSVDMKWSDHVTVSYNEFIDCHKTSLVGGKADQIQDYITYHHNWFNNTHSRNPRARNAHIHSFNNYFTTNGEYGICASYNSKIFSENNYFEQTQSPLYAINMGKDQFSGTIKSFGDVFDNCKPDDGLAYAIVNSRTDSPAIPNLIEGGDSYDNFDLNMYSYTPQTPQKAKATVMQYAGRMKSQPGSVPPKEEEHDPVAGDINRDGTCSIADAILLHKWLLAEPDTVLPDWQAGDLNSDGRLNAADLTLLKRRLLSI